MSSHEEEVVLGDAKLDNSDSDTVETRNEVVDDDVKNLSDTDNVDKADNDDAGNNDDANSKNNDEIPNVSPEQETHVEEEKSLLMPLNGNPSNVSVSVSSDHELMEPTDSNQNKPDPRQSLMVEDVALAKKERLANIKLFLVNYSFLLMFYMSQNIYNIGVIRTIERKYGLRSAQSGVIMSMNDISHIMVVIFVGYFGRKAHKPRFLSISLLLCALAAFLMATPYFIFGADNVAPLPTLSPPGVPTPQALKSPPGNVTNVPYQSIHPVTHIDDPSVCDPDRPDYICTDEQVEEDSANMAAYYIMLTAQFISGAGGSGVTTLGFSYIDENAPSHRSALYLGVVSSMFSLAPVTALGLAALCLKLPEDPSSSTTLVPGDSQWIGCWWLGYVICGVGIILSCIPMWFFPKYIIRHEKTSRDELSVREQLKEFPSSTLSLLKNAPYMTLVLMSVLLMYVITGLYSNLPRYMEVHFLQPAFIASFVAVSGAVAGVFGGVLGGLIMHKWKIRPRGATKIIIFSSAVMCVGVAVNMCLGCPQLEMAGHWQDDGKFSVTMPCNSNCGCLTNRQSYSPVCGQDGLTYFSPCHAGCTHNSNGSYAACSCVIPQNSTKPPNAPPIGTPTDAVTSGTCGIVCNMLVAYIIVSCIFSLVGSICRAPTAIVLFRIVGDEQRSFALGISSFLTNLLAFIPAPVMFGAIIDSTCILWSSTCSGTGSCLLYDTRMFRLAIHGSALAFKVLALICSIIVFVLVKDKFFPEKGIILEKVVNEEDDKSQDKAAMLDEKPIIPEESIQV